MSLSRHSFRTRSQTGAETVVTAGAPADTPHSADASPASVSTVAASTHPHGGSQAAAEACVAAEWKVGDIILDLYEVKQIHEGGGMGLVYRVDHRGWNTDLAVKSPRQEHFQTEAQKENFTRECETWIKLGLHPHIVSCYYVRRLGGVPRVFAEYVEGGSLKEWIDSQKLYAGRPQEALKRILDISIQTAWGLQYAHTQGVIHQDVKPANVLLTPEGTAKITDFGLARARASAAEPAEQDQRRSILVSHGGMTPAYCSPEQARREPLTRKTDIWSWAVTVLEMFVGEACWQSGMAAPEVLGRFDELRLAGAGLPEMPRTLRDLLSQCFAENLEARPKDMALVARSLEEIYAIGVQQGYSRTPPEPVELRADALNNRAVSFVDLGRDKDALDVWEQALAVDPQHLEAVYNRGITLWRQGRITDDVLCESLVLAKANSNDNWRGAFFLGLVHWEREDRDAALRELEEAKRTSGGAIEVVQALARAQLRTRRGGRLMRALPTQSGSVVSVAFDSDGNWALSGNSDKEWQLGKGGDKSRPFHLQDVNPFAGAIGDPGEREYWCDRKNKSYEISLCESATGRQVRTFKGHKDAITSMAMLPGGRWLVSASADRTLRLWELGSGRCLRTFEGHNAPVASVAVSSDGRFAVSASDDKTLRLWELSTGRCLRVLKGHQDGVRCVAISDDGRSAVSGSADRTLRLWDQVKGSCLKVLEGHTHSLVHVAISTDGRSALSAATDGTICLWECATGRCFQKFMVISNTEFQVSRNEILAVAASPDLRWVVSGGGDKHLRVWDSTSGRCLRTFEEVDRILSAAVSADGCYALSGSADATPRLWGLPAGNVLSPYAICRPRTTAELGAVAGKVAAALRRAETMISQAKWAEAAEAANEARSHSGYSWSKEALAILARTDRFGVRRKLVRAKNARTLMGHTTKITAVAISPDGRWGLSGNTHFGAPEGKKALCLWDLASGTCVNTFNGFNDSVYSLAITPDGSCGLSGGGHSLRIWEMRTGRCIRSEGSGTLRSVSTAGHWLLSGADRSLRLSDLATGRCVREIADAELDSDLQRLFPDKPLGSKVGSFHVSFASLTPDCRFALAGISAQPQMFNPAELVLWDLRMGRFVRRLNESKSRCASISPDGTCAVSASVSQPLADRQPGYPKSAITLRSWDLRTGLCTQIFEGHEGWINCVAIAPESRWVLSGSDDKTLRLWELGTGRCVQTLEGHTDAVTCVAISADGRWVLSGSADGSVMLWELEWEYDFPSPADWDDGATPYLESFLTLHCPVGEDGFTPVAKPQWSEKDLNDLITDLQTCGYGWLRADGVKRHLARMVEEMKEPRPSILQRFKALLKT